MKVVGFKSGSVVNPNLLRSSVRMGDESRQRASASHDILENTHEDHPASSTLSWLDDDYRIDAAVPVIFGGGVGRIVQSDTIDEELVSVFAGR